MLSTFTCSFRNFTLSRVPLSVRSFSKKVRSPPAASVRDANKEVEKHPKSNNNNNNNNNSNRGHGDSTKVILTLSRIGKQLPNGDYLFRDMSLGMYEGAKIGVLGLNGSGKSSLLKIIAGEDNDFEGEVKLNSGTKVGFLRQEPILDDDSTVGENIFSALEGRLDPLFDLERVTTQLERVTDDQTLRSEHERLSLIVKENGLHNLRSRIEKTSDALRCPPINALVANLSGGERRRVALCRLLVSQPGILLLDEPTNHLDAASVAWLEHFLGSYRGTVMAVTHDRYFLDNVAGWILELDRGRVFPFRGNYTNWLRDKIQRLEREEKSQKNREKAMKKELDWINRPTASRHAKSKARFQRYTEMSEEARIKPYEPGKISIPHGPPLGNVVIEVSNVTMSIGDKLLFEDLSFSVPPGAIVGVVGANGTGKSTLFRIITDEMKPQSGSVRIGSTVKLGYVSQSRDSLDDNLTIIEEIGEGEDSIDYGETRVNIRQFISAFNFRGTDQEKLIGSLSGGERNRVHFAKMIKSAPNVILLDEPSNDLDVEVLRSLEEALDDFSGSAIVISHDRWFLDRICTHILAFEGDGKVYFYQGNYRDYVDDCKRRGQVEKSVSFKRLGL